MGLLFPIYGKSFKIQWFQSPTRSSSYSHCCWYYTLLTTINITIFPIESIKGFYPSEIEHGTSGFRRPRDQIPGELSPHGVACEQFVGGPWDILGHIHPDGNVYFFCQDAEMCQNAPSDGPLLMISHSARCRQWSLAVAARRLRRGMGGRSP